MKRPALLLIALILAFSAALTAPLPAQADPLFVTAWVDLPVVTRMDTQTLHFNSDGFILISALNGEPVYDGQQINMFWRSLGTYTLVVTAIHNGEVATATATFEMIATLESLKGSLAQFCQQSYINKPSVCRSFQKKLDVMIRLEQQGNKRMVRGLLRGLANEITVLSTKGRVPVIFPPVAQILLGDINYIMAH